jgi:DNA replication and repair protein RecF
LNIPYKINVSFTSRQAKEISSNSGNNLLPKNIIGEMPLVVLSPDNKKITSGSPDFRRQFVNSILSQASKIYLEKLYELRKILKQRNTLLGLFKNENANINNQILSQLDQ